MKPSFNPEPLLHEVTRYVLPTKLRDLTNHIKLLSQGGPHFVKVSFTAVFSRLLGGEGLEHGAQVAELQNIRRGRPPHKHAGPRRVLQQTLARQPRYRLSHRGEANTDPTGKLLIHQMAARGKLTRRKQLPNSIVSRYRECGGHPKSPAEAAATVPRNKI